MQNLSKIKPSRKFPNVQSLFYTTHINVDLAHYKICLARVGKGAIINLGSVSTPKDLFLHKMSSNKQTLD